MIGVGVEDGVVGQANSRAESEVQHGVMQVLDGEVAAHVKAMSALDIDIGALYDDVVPQASDDLLALAERDPAAGKNWAYVLATYRCFRAVLAYRLAHAIQRSTADGPSAYREDRLILARQISEAAKVRTGVEIHPGATIGPRFVIDHGSGTVIGESTTIGADCYVLQGVICGANGIALNPRGKRHPSIGDRVQVGAFARIIGNIEVGDDVLIGPHAVVARDIPPDTQVLVMTECQVSRRKSVVYVSGIAEIAPGCFELLGSGLGASDLSVTLVDGNDIPVAGTALDIIDRQPGRLRCQVRGSADTAPGREMFLRICNRLGEYVLVTPPRRMRGQLPLLAMGDATMRIPS